MQATGEWGEIFKLLKGKICQPQILYSTKLPFTVSEKEMLSQSNTEVLHGQYICLTRNGKRFFIEKENYILYM